MMTIEFQEIVLDVDQGDGRRDIQYKYTDHLGVNHLSSVNRRSVSFDADADLLAQAPVVELELSLDEVLGAIFQASLGVNPDKVPSDHQSQADFDRRVLGRMMLTDNVHVFYAAYPMFQAVESRGGANAIQRAAYLGITKEVYDLIAERFNNVSGAAGLLADEKSHIWPELPGAFV